jgi:hypothetical protein
MPVAFGNLIGCLAKAPISLRSCRPPVRPPRKIFLKEKPGPPIMPVSKQHLPIKFIQIGSRFRSRQTRPGNRKKAVHQRLTLLNQSRRFVRPPLPKQLPSGAVYLNQLSHSRAIPRVRTSVPLRRIRTRCAPNQNQEHRNYKNKHYLSISVFNPSAV